MHKSNAQFSSCEKSNAQFGDEKTPKCTFQIHTVRQFDIDHMPGSFDQVDLGRKFILVQGCAHFVEAEPGQRIFEL